MARAKRRNDYPPELNADLHPDALITPDHAAALTGRSAYTLRKMAAAGEFVPVVTLGHRTKRYRYGDVIAWLRKKRAESETDRPQPPGGGE